ncbi:MAG: pentapeptide repeat-containing protein [Acidobacteria bacterium]|nr:pentapeptide repeat-containing protein [Acidobacteriota bacterium]MCB9397948.1 pentapeptide repeat-containing protein [Acidobacteriota bacterium]
MNLSGFSLGHCDLSGKCFRGADLSFAHLGCSLLRGSDLRNANLRHANLGAADLTGADLRYSDLRSANLSGAILLGADLRESMQDEPLASSGPLLVPHLDLEETEAFSQAKDDGFFPLQHWGHQYQLATGETLYKSPIMWPQIKRKLGGLIFGDTQTFKEVRLVQQYKHYSQWAYMLSRTGFERVMNSLGLKVAPKSTVS